MDKIFDDVINLLTDITRVFYEYDLNNIVFTGTVNKLLQTSTFFFCILRITTDMSYWPIAHFSTNQFTLYLLNPIHT